MEKVGWKLAGDKAPEHDRRGRRLDQVIRCDGHHMTIGREPSDADYAANKMYGCFGFGGAQMAWRLIATGEEVGGRNCWSQGMIPAEFRDLLPDNAVRLVSEQERRSAEAAAKWAEKQKAREALRESLKPFSASGRVHPIPEQVLLHVENMDDDYDDQVGETRTVTRDLDVANVMSSQYQGYVGLDWAEQPDDNDWHRPVLDLDLSAQLIPSSTPGHFHLFLDHAMRWDDYKALLGALAEAGIVEEGYVKASIERGHTAVRLPWVKKGASTEAVSADDAAAEMPTPVGGEQP